MSVNPINFRLPLFDLESEEGRQSAHRYLASGIVDLNQAIAALNQKTGTAMVTNTTVVETGGGGSGSSLVVGGVNNQIGQPSYTTQQSDYGVKILLGDSSPVALTLSPAVTTPWFAFIGNDSSAMVLLAAGSGATLFGQAYVAPGCFGIIFFDGANFWSEGTPIAADSSPGIVAPDGVTIGIDSGMISTIGVTGTITTAALTALGLQGSMTYKNGVLISQVQAT